MTGIHSEKVLHEVVEEVPVALFVNGRHAMTAMMSPVQLEDFVTGYLFTEQIIKGVEEIESIRIEKNRISVITKNLFKVLGPKKTILSGCGGSVSYIDAEKLPRIKSDFDNQYREDQRIDQGCALFGTSPYDRRYPCRCFTRYGKDHLGF